MAEPTAVEPHPPHARRIVAPRPVRVASVPSAHPYVAHLGVEDDGAARRLPDPPVRGAPRGQWWPPRMLSADWIAEHADAFDVLHVHFGTESSSPTELRRAVDALRAARRPLVFTVHDLEHPQLLDQGAYLAQLDVLVPAADALITLTPGAAAEIDRRWGRHAAVIPHPHVVPLDGGVPLAGVSGGRAATVGVSLRDLRPNVDGLGATTTLLRAVGRLRAAGRDVEARVEIRDQPRDTAQAAAIARLCAADSHARLVRSPRLAERALFATVAALDACVLPYRHGTHSGWLELCWDLGVPVVTPDVGFFADQHPEAAAGATFASGDDDGLAAALGRLMDRSPRAGSAERAALVEARRAHRRAQRAEIASAHLRVYERAIAAATRRH